MHEGETVWVEAPAPHGTCGAVKRLKMPGAEDVLARVVVHDEPI